MPHSKRELLSLLAILISAAASIPLFADAPSEHFHVKYEEIAPRVLRDAIGILTINSRAKAGQEIQTYELEGKEFKAGRKLKIKTETKPVSNFGYVWAEQIEDYRYPIVTRQERFYCIVSDPVTDLRVWINLDDLKPSFTYGVVMIDTFTPGHGAMTPINIFHFTQSGRRKLYAQPDAQATFSIVSNQDYPYRRFYVQEQQGNFIKVAWAIHDHASDSLKIEALGWIKIRDKVGRLTFWFEMYDDC